jgi:hypothetical protein
VKAYFLPVSNQFGVMRASHLSQALSGLIHKKAVISFMDQASLIISKERKLRADFFILIYLKRFVNTGSNSSQAFDPIDFRLK